MATVAVGGPQAVSRVGRFFQPVAGRPLDRLPENRILLGRWQTAAETGEELIVCRRETTVEIHCHGGHAAAQVVIESLASAGCQVLPWQQVLAKTGQDPITIEATRALAQAVTQRTAAILLDQRQGALRRALDQIARCLAAGDAATAGPMLEQLLQAARWGPYLIRPFRVVICGLPNAGKSSLINALAGYPRALVSQLPGTTRDVLTARIALDGWSVELADTAGLRKPSDPIEWAGIEQAQAHGSYADLVVLVFDRSRAWSEQAERVYRNFPDALVTHNKIDLPGSGIGNRPEGILTSALSGQGIDRLAAAILRRLVPRPPGPREAIPFTRRQRELLAQTKEAVEHRRFATATDRLRRIYAREPLHADEHEVFENPP